MQRILTTCFRTRRSWAVSAFGAAPGYKNPNDIRGLPEKYGLAAILDKTHNMDGNSKLWVLSVSAAQMDARVG